MELVFLPRKIGKKIAVLVATKTAVNILKSPEKTPDYVVTKRADITPRCLQVSLKISTCQQTHFVVGSSLMSVGCDWFLGI